ncbi:MAG: hypothetical protein WC955_12185 [Elusimicrobiota bacterium]
MTNKYQGWKKNLKTLCDECTDINHKLTHIIEQTRQIYHVLSCLDDWRGYNTGKTSDYASDDENSV